MTDKKDQKEKKVFILRNAIFGVGQAGDIVELDTARARRFGDLIEKQKNEEIKNSKK